MKLIDKYGWPVVTFSGKPSFKLSLTNLLRRIIHTNIRETLKARYGKKKQPVKTTSDDTCAQY